MNSKPASLRTSLAGVSALLVSSMLVPAAITWSGPQDIPIPTNFAGVYLDLAAVDGNPMEPTSGGSVVPGSYTIGYDEPAEWDVNFFFNGIAVGYSPTFQPARADGNNSLSRILNVAPASTVDDSLIDYLGIPGADYGGSGKSNDSNVGESHFGAVPDFFQSEQLGYIAFVLNPENPAEKRYGWMAVTLVDGDAVPGTIHQWAYSDTPISVGQIPEPTSVALLLAGTAMMLRRRRN